MVTQNTLPTRTTQLLFLHVKVIKIIVDLTTPTTSKPASDPKLAQNRPSTKQQSTKASTNQPAPKEELQQQITQTQPTKLTHKQKTAKPRQEPTQETKQAHLTRNHPNQKLLQPNNFTPNSPQLKKTTHTQLKN